MKKCMRVLSLIIVFVFVFGMLPVLPASAADSSGTVGNCNWVYTDASKTLIITPVAGSDGKTVSYDYSNSNVHFASIADTVTTLVIEEGVTSLGHHLFAHFSALTSVEFPHSSLVTLGEGVFRNCDALVSITLPDSLTRVDRSQFWDCAKLETVVLGGSYTMLSGIMLGNCPKLTTVTIPASVTALDMSVSGGGVKRGVFYNSPNVTTICYGGTRTQWEALVAGLQEGSSDIGLLSSSAVTVVCADDVSTGETGNCTWSYNKLTNVLTVSPKAGTDGTTASYANPDANTSFPSIKDAVKSVVIEDGVTALGSHLFNHFSVLESVTFPQSSLVALGEGVFRNCDALVSMTVPDSVTSVGRTLFYGCDSLETVTLGGSYTMLPGIMLAACPKLKTVTIPASVTALDMSVSGGGVKRGVFYNSSNLATIHYGGTKAQWKALLNGLTEGSSDITLLNGDDITVICSDGTYVPGSNDDTPGTLGQPLEIYASDGTVTKFFAAAIEKDKVYKLTASWAQAPTLTGVKSEWEIESWTASTGGTRCETLFQATKRESAAAGTTTQGFELIFKAAKDASALALNVQNLSVDNAITVTLEEAALDENVAADVTIRYAANTDMGSNLFDLAMQDGRKYIVEAQWASTPYHKGTNNGGTGTAWKFQPVTDEEFWGNNAGYYYSVTATGTTPVAVQQNATGKFTANDTYTMFNIYAQRVCEANSIHVTVKEDNTPVVPFTASVDYATAEKLFAVPFTTDSGNASNYLQGLEIYNDIVFLVYDGGYVRTYDFKTGAFIQEFRLECALESNHAGGATFSKYKYAEDDPFPLMYVSCDLSTLGCYVERITYDANGDFQSEMVQYLDFSGLTGWKDGDATSAGVHTHNGSLAMIEKDSDTIVYLGRQLRSIGDAENKFVMAHFDLPECTQGNVAGKVYQGGYTIVGESASDTITVDCPVVHFTNDDILEAANARQDADGYYYWDYYGRYYQGSCVFHEQVMMSHGVNPDYPNVWGDKTFYTGIMNYAYDSDKMSRFLDVTGSIGWYGEPQGLLVYQGRLLHIMTHDGYGVYELKIKLDDLKDAYDLACCANVDALKAAITAAVEADLDDAFSVDAIVLPENFAITGEAQTFTAAVSVYTTWNVQTYEIEFTLDAHSFTSYVSDNNATCEADGTKTAECGHGCGATDTAADVGSKLGHQFTDYKSDDNATCTADGTKTAKCDRCDKTDTIKEAHYGHKLTKVDGKAATCTEAGVTGHYNCSVCKKNFADAEGKTEKSNVTIAAGHTLSKVDGKAATETENGHKEHYSCASCGKLFADAEGKSEVTKDSLVISATGTSADPVPDTSDTFTAAPAVLLALMSVAASLITVKKKED